MPNRFSKTRKEPMQALKNRVKEMREIPAKNIMGAPFNFRTHPENQQEALAACIEDIGFTSPLIVFQTPDLPDEYVMMIDGHARQDLISSRIGPETLIPCIITDLDEAEARRALLTHDALGAMAQSDKDKLDALLRDMQTEDQDLADMLEDLAKKAKCEWAKRDEEEGGGNGSITEKFNILVECESEQQQAELLERLSSEGLSVKSLIA